MTLFVPEGGFPIGNEIVIKYPTFDKFIHSRKKERVKIDDLLTGLDTTMKEDIPVDTFIRHNNKIGTELGAPSDTSTGTVDASRLQRIEFGPQGPTVLHSIFQKLEEASAAKKNVRILHYGDSQIEGDRITGYIRQRLQAKFGGNGPGMIAAFNQYHTMSFVQTVSPNFKRHTVFGEVSKEITHKKYGSMGTFARFTKYVPDSLLSTLESTEGWIEIGMHKQAYGNSKKFNRVRLFYGNCRSRVEMIVSNNGEVIHEDTLIPDGNYHVVELLFENTPEQLRYTFKGKDSPDFYGFSLDGNYGVTIDNVAMRGGSGTFLGKCDGNLLSRMYSDLGVEMFIMQFGGNTMPYLKDAAASKQYANYFQSNLNTLKRLRPGASIIVIGPSDMSTKVDGEYMSYPLLGTLIADMKQAAFNAGAGYWDIYSAMGGENSMLTWVEKGLAGEDYTHFSPSGSRIIAEKFWEAFLYEYQQYQKGVQP